MSKDIEEEIRRTYRKLKKLLSRHVPRDAIMREYMLVNVGGSHLAWEASLNPDPENPPDTAAQNPRKPG